MMAALSQTPLFVTLTRLVEEHRVRDIDWQVARQIQRYECLSHPDNPVCDALVLVAALTSWVLGRGQVCLPLDHCPMVEVSRHWLDQPRWITALSACRCVWVTPARTAADPVWAGQPLVLELPHEAGGVARVYLARYFFYQIEVAQRIHQLLSDPALPPQGSNSDQRLGGTEAAPLPHVLQRLFDIDTASDTSSSRVNWQLVAAATACLHRFAVITGGPGTGKTTTVTRLMCALLSQQPDMSIALAAPTGKAAARMTESIRQARERGGLPESLVDKIPDDSFTLHRLLGWTPSGFRYNHRHALAWDCVVVDEASMIDLAMMHQLLSAIPAHGRLILLGDKDQLASVEAGSVLADVCNAGGDDVFPSVVGAERLSSLTGYSVSDFLSPNAIESLVSERDTTADASVSGSVVSAPCVPMQDAVAQLRVSHRFDANSGIGQLAQAVNQGHVSRSIQCFSEFDDIQCDWLIDEDPTSLGALASASGASQLHPWQRGALVGYQAYCRCIQAPAPGVPHDAVAVLQALNHFRVLVSTRKGPLGVESVNARIEQLLFRAGLLRQGASQNGAAGVWYPGRPVMVTRNDYDLGLFNGDIGVLVTSPSGDARVAFMTADNTIRYVLPSRLPSYETAFAMTVHKSQGSEFGRVQLLLPEQWQRVITRELIYTAITRAKQHFYLLSGRECWKRGLLTRVERASGLRDALWKSL